MKTFSYIFDLAVFFTLLTVFEADWLVAFILSGFAGWLIRAVFVDKRESEQTEPQ